MVKDRSASLGLARRIVVGVSVGIVLMQVLFGLVALVTINTAIEAAGREQVMIATMIATDVAQTLTQQGVARTADESSGTPLHLIPLLPSADAPGVQVLSETGHVLDQIHGASARMTAEHLVLLHSLIASRQAGYRIHWPDAGDTFEPHVVAYAPIPGYAALGVTVQQFQHLALMAPSNLVRRLIIAGVLALGVAIGITWIDVTRVVRPLQSLTVAAEAFAAGKLDEPVITSRGDEIGSLAQSFEVMRQRLRQSLSEIERWNRELEERVERRTREVERRNRQLAAINAVAEPLAGALDVTAVLSQTLNRICAVTGFEVASYRWATAEKALPLVANCNLPSSMASETVRLGGCLCGRAMRINTCQIARTVADEKEAEACRQAGIVSAVAVPLRSADQVEGVLFLGSRQERLFEPGDLDTLLAIGQQVGMAIANSRLYSALQERNRERAQLVHQVMAAQEDERRRVAAELHDQVSQALASILMGVDAQTARRESGSIDGNDLVELRGLIARTLDEVHNLAVELRPSILDDAGLVAALERLIGDFQRRHGLVIDFQTVNTDGLRLSPAAETALFRIAQAALSNVVHHAAALTVSVLLQRRSDRLILVVEDDGSGFDIAAIKAAPLKDRLGLAGIEERVQLIGGKLTIESDVGRGTTVFVDLSVASNIVVEGMHESDPGLISR